MVLKGEKRKTIGDLRLTADWKTRELDSDRGTGLGAPQGWGLGKEKAGIFFKAKTLQLFLSYIRKAKCLEWCRLAGAIWIYCLHDYGVGLLWEYGIYLGHFEIMVCRYLMICLMGMMESLGCQQAWWTGQSSAVHTITLGFSGSLPISTFVKKIKPNSCHINCEWLHFSTVFLLWGKERDGHSFSAYCMYLETLQMIWGRYQHFMEDATQLLSGKSRVQSLV